jgi:hypothetical protein
MAADRGMIVRADHEPPLVRGAEGPWVALLQVALNGLGVGAGNDPQGMLKVDGVFGGRTERSLRSAEELWSDKPPTGVLDRHVAEVIWNRFVIEDDQAPVMTWIVGESTRISFDFDGPGWILTGYNDTGRRVCPLSGTSSLTKETRSPDRIDRHIERAYRMLGRSPSEAETEQWRSTIVGDCVAGLTDIEWSISAGPEAALVAERSDAQVAIGRVYEGILGRQIENAEALAHWSMVFESNGLVGLVEGLQASDEAANVKANTCAGSTGIGLVEPHETNCDVVASGPGLSNGTLMVQVTPLLQLHPCLADTVALLIAHAAADGVHLDGSGWRSHLRQHQLREINGCPDGWTHSDNERIDDFAPSWECRVPTARPGGSLHERGLAVDWRNCGSRETACFRWLDESAQRYGLFNLPAEPWHWSVNGR